MLSKKKGEEWLGVGVHGFYRQCFDFSYAMKYSVITVVRTSIIVPFDAPCAVYMWDRLCDYVFLTRKCAIERVQRTVRHVEIYPHLSIRAVAIFDLHGCCARYRSCPTVQATRHLDETWLKIL